MTVIWLLLSFIASCASPSPKDTAPASAPKPNVVLIVADDLGWSDLSCYGNPFFESPNLDRLAGGGMRFTQAYSACHVCSPTRASILTGRYPARVGLTNYLYGTKTVEDSPVLPAPFVDRLPLEEVTLAEELKDEGYLTALVGKWHLGENTSLGESDPDLQGFDVTESWDYGLLPVGSSYQWYHTGDSITPYELPALTEEITRNTETFIAEHRDTNFFLMVAHYAVHLPLQGRTDLIEKYDAKPNDRPDDYHPVYAAMIEQMDSSVGRIVHSLEENGLMDNTLILFVSDNGGLAIGEAGDKPTVNDPLRSGKGTMYEGGIRVPMIAYWQGRIAAGEVSPAVMNTVDIFPTIMQLVGAKVPSDRPIDGRDRLAVLKGTADGGESRDLFWHYPHFSNQGGRPRTAIRRGDYKLIESLEDGDLQLYDLAADLDETDDLTATRPGLADTLRAALHEWRDGVDANMPIPK